MARDRVLALVGIVILILAFAVFLRGMGYIDEHYLNASIAQEA